MTNPVSDKAQQVLVTLLEKAVVGIDAAVSFSQAQIPDVIQQLLMWNLVQSVLQTILIVILAYPVYRFVVQQVKKTQIGVVEVGHKSGEPLYKTNLVWDSEGDVHPGVLIVGLLVITYGAFAFATLTNLVWLKIWIAPKLYLIEYAAHLIGGK